MESIWQRSARICFQSPGIYVGLTVFLFITISRGDPIDKILLGTITMFGLFYLMCLVVGLIITKILKNKNQKTAK